MITPSDMRTIYQIANRASDLYRAHGVRIGAAYIESEIGIVHEEIVNLRLRELLDSDAGNFMHEIAGIHQHLVICPGSNSFFSDCFVPRFAARQVAA